MPLDVIVYSDLDDEDGASFSNIDYVSLVSDETYGPPALVAPAKDNKPMARPGDRVLYLNTRFVPMFEIMRTSS